MCLSTWRSLAVASCVPTQAMSFWYCFTLLVSLNFVSSAHSFSQLTPFFPVSANSAYSGGFSWPSALKCWKIATLICFPFYSHLHFFFLIPFTTGYSSCILIGWQIYFTYETRNSMVVGTPFCWLFMSLIPLYGYITVHNYHNIWIYYHYLSIQHLTDIWIYLV